jgi:large subunit ribosomal protein L14
MIFKNSKLYVGDNTGIKKVKCIRVLKKNSKIGNLGDIILFSIKKTSKKKTYIKKKMYLGLLINLKKKSKRLDGSYIKFNQNALISLSENFKVLGTRLFFPISKELKKKKKNELYKKVLSNSKYII